MYNYVARGVTGPGEERRQLGQLPHSHQEVCEADQQQAAASHHAQGQAFALHCTVQSRFEFLKLLLN